MMLLILEAVSRLVEVGVQVVVLVANWEALSDGTNATTQAAVEETALKSCTSLWLLVNTYHKRKQH